jgi:cytochrome c
MKRVMTAALLSLCLAPPAMASKDLAQAKNCLGCHAVDSKVVGPS